MDSSDHPADGAAPGAPPPDAAEVPDSFPEAEAPTVEADAEVETEEGNQRERWADVTDSVEPAVPAVAAALVEPSTGADVEEWIEVKREAGVDEDGSLLVEGENNLGDGAATGAPVVSESEPTISVPDPRDIAQDLQEEEFEDPPQVEPEINPKQEVEEEVAPEVADEATTDPTTTADGAALGAPADPSQRIDLDDDDEPIDDESQHPEALPRPLTTTEVRTGSSPAQSSQTEPKQKRRGTRSGKHRQQRKATKTWSDDFRRVISWLRNQTRKQPFTLKLVSHEEATPYQIQFIALFEELQRRLSDNQILVLLSRLFRDYQRYAESCGHRGGGYQEFFQIKANNPVAPFAEVFARAQITPWFDPYLAQFGPSYTAPKAASGSASTNPDGAASGAPASASVGATPKPVVLKPASAVKSGNLPKAVSKPKEPSHPPPGWQPTLFRTGGDGAAESAPVDTSQASAAAGGPSVPPTRTVHLAPDPTPETESVKVAIPREQAVAAIVEAVARGFEGDAIPPPPVAPPAPVNTASGSAVAPVPNYPPPPAESPPSDEQLEASALAEAIRRSLGEQGQADTVVVVTPAPSPRQTSPRERPSKRSAEPDSTDGAAPVRPSPPQPSSSSRGRELPTVPRGLTSGRSRSTPPVADRPVILRPRVPGYPYVRVQQGETWFRGGGQNFVPHVAPTPPLHPRPFGSDQHQAVHPEDPYDLPQHVWHDPSLYQAQNVAYIPRTVRLVDLADSDLNDPPQPVPVVPTFDLTPDQYQQFLFNRYSFNLSGQLGSDAVEAEPVDLRPRRPPTPPPAKRARPTIRVISLGNVAKATSPGGAAPSAPSFTPPERSVPAAEESTSAEVPSEPVAPEPEVVETTPAPAPISPSPVVHQPAAEPEVPDEEEPEPIEVQDQAAESEPGEEPHVLEGQRSPGGHIYKTPPKPVKPFKSPPPLIPTPKGSVGTATSASVPPPTSSSAVPSSTDGAASGAPEASAGASSSAEATAPGTAEPCTAIVAVGRAIKCPPPSDDILRQNRAILEARKKAAAEALIAKAKEEPKAKQKARPTTNPPAPVRPVPKPPPPAGGAATGAPAPNTEPPTLETASPPPKPRPESNLAQPAREERPRPRNDSVNRDEAYRRALEWTQQRRAEQHQAWIERWHAASVQEQARLWEQERESAHREGRHPRSPHTVGQYIPQEPSGSAHGAASGAPYRRINPAINTGDAGVIKVVLDWNGVLNTYLDPFGRATRDGRNRLARPVDAAQGRLEYHILSFTGQNRAESTQQEIDWFIDDIRGRGIPFVSGSICRERTKEGGKADCLSALGAHAILDDTDYIITECIKTKVWGYVVPHWDTNYGFCGVISDWIIAETVEGILRNRRAHPLQPSQYVHDPRSWRDNPHLRRGGGGHRSWSRGGGGGSRFRTADI